MEEKMMREKSPATRGAATSGGDDMALLPPVDVMEDPSGITLYADLPGVPKEKLSVQVEVDVLIVEGEMSLNMPQNMEATVAEVSLPRYRRVFTLSKDLDTAKLSAELKQGVLKLRIPKVEHAQPHRIKVAVA
jgi:HSP20 family molecular chaperone IbpA